MQAATNLLDPKVSWPAALPVDADLRKKFFALDAGLLTQRTQTVSSPAIRDEYSVWVRWSGKLVTQAARFLEFIQVAGTTWELLSRAGESSLERYGIDALRRDVIACCGLDPVEVARSVRGLIPGVEAPSPDTPLPSRDVIVREIRGIVEAYPADELLIAAQASGRPEWARRAEAAIRSLRLFLMRNDADIHQRVDMFGELYQIGRLDIPQIAALLRESDGDTIALLEARGFSRRIDAIPLDDLERSAKLRSIRIDRIRRAAKQDGQLFPHYVDRSVIASSRIEGIDARAWLTRPNADDNRE